MSPAAGENAGPSSIGLGRYGRCEVLVHAAYNGYAVPLLLRDTSSHSVMAEPNNHAQQDSQPPF